MYNKKDIEKILNEFNYFIDEVTLNNFIKNWKIDPIYEDEDGVEFFDNLSISKLKKGISLKSQGYTNDQIIYHISKLVPEKTEVAKKEIASTEMKNVTLDITQQTLQVIADAVAQKITEGIKNSDFITGLLSDSSLKQDNENLSRKVEELTQDNKKLAQRVEELEKSKRLSLINFEFFRKFFN